MVWKGRALEDLPEIVKAIFRVRSREEAAAFLEAYSKDTPKSEYYSNVRHIISFFPEEDQWRLYTCFDMWRGAYRPQPPSRPRTSVLGRFFENVVGVPSEDEREWRQ